MFLSPSPPFLFIQFIQIMSLNKRDKKSFDLVSFEDTQIESRAVAGDTSAQAGRSGFCPGPCRDEEEPAVPPPEHPRMGPERLHPHGEGALGALGFFGSRFRGCPGDGAVFLWPLPPVPLTSQSV